MTIVQTVPTHARFTRFPIPDSRFPIPDSRFPIPDSRFPTGGAVAKPGPPN